MKILTYDEPAETRELHIVVRASGPQDFSFQPLVVSIMREYARRLDIGAYGDDPDRPGDPAERLGASERESFTDANGVTMTIQHRNVTPRFGLCDLRQKGSWKFGVLLFGRYFSTPRVKWPLRFKWPQTTGVMPK